MNINYMKWSRYGAHGCGKWERAECQTSLRTAQQSDWIRSERVHIVILDAKSLGVPGGSHSSLVGRGNCSWKWELRIST